MYREKLTRYEREQRRQFRSGKYVLQGQARRSTFKWDRGFFPAKRISYTLCYTP